MPKLSIVKTTDGWQISGSLTENADFGELLTAKNQQIHLHLDKVSRVNSSGVREWMTALKTMHSQGCQVSLHSCSPEIVYQFNYLRSFLQGAKVVSIQLPYFCESCDQEKLVAYELAQHDPAKFEDKRPCPSCGNSMAFDDFPDSYFGFWKPTAA